MDSIPKTSGSLGLFGKYVCTYCGDFATERDHPKPVSVRGRRRGRMQQISYSRDHVVPSCSECNRTLSNLAIYSIGRRASYLHRRLRDKYKDLLRTKRWTERQLDELSPKMRGYVKNWENDRPWVMSRLTHLEAVAAISPTIADVWAEIGDE